MTETVTLQLPADLVQQARTVANQTQRPFVDVLEDWIRRAGAEPILESLPDAELLVVCDQAMNPTDEEELAELLERNREGLLTPAEQTRLDERMRAYRTGLVRKAQALKVAVQRGLRPPLS